jgi:hypothetical protein
MATIVTRAGKGSALTFTEGDANFTNLNTAKLENVVEDTTPQLGGNLDVNGKSITAALDANVDIAVTGEGTINLSHGQITDEGGYVSVGNGVNNAVIRSNGDTTLYIGGSNVVLAPEEDVGFETSTVVIGTGDAAPTITTNGAYNLVIGTNAATVGTSPLITLEQNSGIVLQATANTNSIRVLNSTLQHFMNNHTAGAQAFFLQAHTTADANNFSLGRARGTTLSPSAVQTGDELAEFFVSGHDGQTGFAGYEAGWGFTTTVIDTPTSNVMPVMTEFKINTDENEMTTYHSISAEDGVFRVIELGTVSGVTDLNISAGEDGNINLKPNGNGRVVIDGSDAEDSIGILEVGDIVNSGTDALVLISSAGLEFSAGSEGIEWRAETDSVMETYIRVDPATGNIELTPQGTGKVILESNVINIAESKTPASATAAGAAGDIAWDADYIYVCTATDTWKRVAISTWS